MSSEYLPWSASSLWCRRAWWSTLRVLARTLAHWRLQKMCKPWRWRCPLSPSACREKESWSGQQFDDKYSLVVSGWRMSRPTRLNCGGDTQWQETWNGLTRTWILATFWWKGGTPHSAWWEGLDPHLQERWSNTGAHWSLFYLPTSNELALRPSNALVN